MLSQRKIGNECIDPENKIRLKETLINTTEKQTKFLANDMYINQMKINKLNKELLVLKEDYAKMIVKSIQKQIRTKSGDVYTIAENFYRLIKEQYLKQY
jgi:hypothetical protein